MLLPEIEYYRPQSLKSLFRLIEGWDPSSSSYCFSGGGTDLIPQLKRHAYKTKKVVSLSGLHSLKDVQVKNKMLLRLGAMTTLNELILSPKIQRHCPIIAETARKVATVQIRTQATIGGNLLANTRCPFFDQVDLIRRSLGPCFKALGDQCHIIKTATAQSDPLCHARFISDLAPVLILLEARLCLESSKAPRQILLKDLYSHS